jgi:hypothetical protein
MSKLLRVKQDFGSLVNEILDKLPQDKLIQGTVCDPEMGGGQFMIEVERRKKAAGLTDQQIAETCYGFVDCEATVYYLYNKYKLLGTYIAHPILERGVDVKFDIIVGNPPYQREENSAKRWTLWEEFVNFSIQNADVIALVVPQSITSPTSFVTICNKCDILNLNVKKHFKVGSTFCYFVYNKNKSDSITSVVTDKEEFKLDISSYPFLPNEVNIDTLAMLNDLLKRNKRIWKRGEFHTSDKSNFCDEGKYDVMHTNAQNFRSNKEHPNRHKMRVAVSLSGYPIFKVITDGYCSQACFWTEVSSLEEAEKLSEECNSEHMQNLMKTFKWSGWNSKEVIQLL